MSGRSRLFGALALGALAGIVALAVVLVGGGSKAPKEAPRASSVPAVRAQAFVAPTSYLFGDTVNARVLVLLDRRRVEPRDVKLDARFFPYTPVAAPTRDVRNSGSLTLVTYSVKLRCLAVACVPRVVPVHLQFAPAHVLYRLPRGNGSLQLTWPPLLGYSRVDLRDLANVDPDREAVWRAQLTSLPRVTYSVSPGLAAGLILGAAGLLILAALVLAAPFLIRLVRLRMPEAPSRPLSPLERALLVLEHDGVGDGSVEARRSALQLVAAELGRQGRPELASSAQQLAWSEPAPPLAAIRRLAKDARRALHVRSNGHGA